jgi:hypothetical protein
MAAMAMEAAAMETTGVVATGVVTVECHRTGRHSCCESHGHHAREKLFSHENLLHPIVRQYRR